MSRTLGFETIALAAAEPAAATQQRFKRQKGG
jgi:hypothetical protein